MLRDNSFLIILAFVFLTVYLLPMYPHGGSANELTRWATAASLIEKGSFDMTWTEPLIGPNVDTAKIGDRIYSNKAPGTAILAAPIYGAMRLFVGEPDASNIRITWFAMRFAISTLPLLLLAFWLYRRGANEFSLATLLFATPLFLYSLLFFSHVFVAVLVYFAFRLMFDDAFGKANHIVLAGALSGLAVISEFPAIFAVLVFGVGLLFKDKSSRTLRLLYFVLGGTPFVIFLLVYNNALFGSPFSMSYAYESFPEWAEVAEQGVFGIGVPSLSNLYLLLFSPSRGLFFSSPILLLAVYAMYRSFDRRNIRKLVRLGTMIVCVLMISGHGAAHGGWAFGPRYLVFLIPLILDPFFEGEADNLPDIFKGGSLTASVLLCVFPALTFPFAPPEFNFPHNDFWASFILGERWVVPTAANVVGLPTSVFLLVPVAVCLVATCYFVARKGSTNGFWIGSLISAALICVYLIVPGIRESQEMALRRASIAERFFSPARRLDKFAADAAGSGNAVSMLNIRNMFWKIADVRSYAPDDFPYLSQRPLEPSPSAVKKSVTQLLKRQKTQEAEIALKSAEETFTFARCEFGTNLAVIYFTSNRKDEALAKLESIVPMVNPGSRPDCIRSQFLLGTLYRELGREADAKTAFQNFLVNSASSNAPEIRNLRKQLQAQ